MPEQNSRSGLSTWINSKLDEDQGRLFKDNKWRFWFPTATGFQALNTALTWYLFPGNLGAIIGCAGALLCWLIICFLHYTDSGHKSLDKWVSILDSAGLVFMVLHFGFLLWAAGHSSLLRDAEAKYEAKVESYNNRIDKDRDRRSEQLKIEAEREKARERAARLEEGAAYWAAKRGTPVKRRPKAQTDSPSLTSESGEEKLESYEKPDKPEGETSTAYLARMDAWIRAMGIGEFLLAVITLITIRYKSTNANHELNTAVAGITSPALSSARMSTPGPSAPLAAPSPVSLHSAGSSSGVTPAVSSVATSPSGVTTQTSPTRDAMALLRDHLREIRKQNPGFFFKADKKPNHVVIRMCRSVGQVDQEVASTRQPLSLLDAVVNRPNRFLEVLIAVLKREGFPIK